LPESLGQFSALLLNGLDASVKNSSNARKSHGCHNQSQYKTNKKFAHDVSLLNAHAVELSATVPVSFDGTTYSDVCASGPFFTNCKKHLFVATGNGCDIPGVPLLTKLAPNDFHIHSDFVAHGTYISSSGLIQAILLRLAL
jgi:hypothetical protein